MSISMQVHIVCDRCGAKGDTRDIELSNSWDRFSYLTLLPMGWIGRKGYALCRSCASALDARAMVHRELNRTLLKFNESKGDNALDGSVMDAVRADIWKECRMPTYVDIHEFVKGSPKIGRRDGGLEA